MSKRISTVIIFLFVSVHFVKDITQDILGISTPLDFLGNINEDLTILSPWQRALYLPAIIGTFFIEAIIVFVILHSRFNPSTNKFHLITYLFLYLVIMFITAFFLDPRFYVLK